MKSQVTAARRALQILLMTLLLAGAAYWHWGLLPGDLKRIPIDAIRRTTGRCSALSPARSGSSPPAAPAFRV